MQQWMKESNGELKEMATSSRILNRRAVRALWHELRGNRLHGSRALALSVLGAAVPR